MAAECPEHCKSKTMMKRLLSACVEASFVQETVYDEIMQEFADFMYAAAKNELENFCVENDHLGTLLCSKMTINCPTAWSVVEMTIVVVTWTAFS